MVLTLMTAPRPAKTPSDGDTAFLRDARVARLATVDGAGTPSCVPVVFAWDGQNVLIPIDRKPKKVNASQLKRVRNISENPKVALVVDDYAEDWSLLRYLMVRGNARYGPSDANAVRILREKYTQYDSMEIDGIITVEPEKFIGWKGAPPQGDGLTPGEITTS